jgi:Uma2 family endonuclease
MPAVAEPTHLSIEDYLSAERAAECKSEYVDGEVFAMSGASIPHNQIGASLSRELGKQLAGRPCNSFTSDMKVWMPLTSTFAYPDASALCGSIETYDEHKDIITNPSFIAEILSESTATYDRGNKFKAYASLLSLQEYLLVSQDEIEAERRMRKGDNTWELQTFSDPEDIITLPSIGCELRLGDLYDKVEFESGART